MVDVKRINAMNTMLSLKNLLSPAGINAHSVYKMRLFKFKLSKSKLTDSNPETGILLPNKVVHTASFFIRCSYTGHHKFPSCTADRLE